MAQDIFAPKSSFNIGYERPVAQPVEDTRGETQAKFQQMANEVQASQIRAQGQIDRAKLGLFNTILGGAEGLAKGYAKERARTAASGVANTWLTDMQSAQDLRDQGKFNEATLFERKATKSAVASGLDLDRYKTEYEAVTGRPMEYVGQTREQQSFEMLKSDKSFQMAFFAARGKLGPQASEEDVMSSALASVQQQAIANDTLALVGAGNKLDWETKVKGAYGTILDQFDDSIIAGLVSRTQQGQPITPGEIDTVLMQHNLMSQKLIKPAYVSEEQWGEVKQRLDLQKEFLTTIKGAKDPDAMLSDIVSRMMQSTEPINAMAVAAASDPSTFAATMGINIPEVMSKVAGSAFSDNNWNSRGQILRDLQQVDVTTPVNANTTFTLDTAPSFLQPYVNGDRGEMKRNVDAGVTMIGKLKPMDMQSEATRKQLYNGVMSITAGMLSDRQFYSSAKVSEVFNNPNLAQSIDMVASVDREAADEMRIALRSAATLQLKAIENNLQSIETTLEFGGYNAGLQWDEEDKKYYITNEGAVMHGRQVFGPGNITDKGLYIDPKLPVAPRGLEDAQDRRRSLSILKRSIEDLTLSGVEDTATAPAATDVGGVPAPQRMEVLDFIKSGEGNYDSSNRGTIGNKIIGTQLSGTTRGGKPLTEMTIGEIKSYQKIEDPNNPNRLFAVGAYQITPDTMDAAMKAAGVTDSTVFSQDVQDRMGLGLMIGSKRPKLAAYIKGESDDIDAAMLEFAKEWASVPDPRTGRSYHGKGNKTQHTVEETRQALINAREAYASGILSEELPPLRDQATQDIINTASQAIEASNQFGNVMPRPTDNENRAAAWDALYGGTHDPETGQIIQGN